MLIYLDVLVIAILIIYFKKLYTFSFKIFKNCSFLISKFDSTNSSIWFVLGEYIIVSLFSKNIRNTESHFPNVFIMDLTCLTSHIPES